MTMKRRAAAVITAIAIGVCALGGVSGCTDDQWRYQPSWSIGLSRLTQDMIDTCQLTPSDVLMIDLYSSQFRRAATGKTCDGIHKLLATYKGRFGEQPTALFNNPASSDNPPSLDSLLYAVVTTNGSPWPGALPDAPSEVLVKLTTDQIVFDRQVFIQFPNEGTTMPLDASERTRFLKALAPVLTWGNPWVEISTSALEMSWWEIAVVTADARLYRWAGYRQPQSNPTATTTMVPPGLIDVYKAFWTLANP